MRSLVERGRSWAYHLRHVSASQRLQEPNADADLLDGLCDEIERLQRQRGTFLTHSQAMSWLLDMCDRHPEASAVLDLVHDEREAKEQARVESTRHLKERDEAWACFEEQEVRAHRLRMQLVAHHELSTLSEAALRESMWQPCQICARAS